jgi:nucleotide-binding universal stress UspA family protein
MSFKNILVAADDFEHAEAIAEHVINHKWGPDAKFRIIHIIEPNKVFAEGFYASDTALSEAHKYGNSLVGTIVKKIEQALPACVTESSVVEGLPVTACLPKPMNGQLILLF